jgi:hypothetical protein
MSGSETPEGSYVEEIKRGQTEFRIINLALFFAPTYRPVSDIAGAARRGSRPARRTPNRQDSDNRAQITGDPLRSTVYPFIGSRQPGPTTTLHDQRLNYEMRFPILWFSVLAWKASLR